MRQADRLIVNTISNYALSILSAAAALVVVPVVVHDLGREGFGLASLLFAVWGMFQLGSNVVGRALERQIPQDRANADTGQLNRTFNTSFVGFVILGFCGAGVVFALRHWLIAGEGLSPAQVADGHRASSLLILWIVFGAPLLVYHKCLGAFQRYDLVGIFTASTMIARAIVVIVGFKLGYGSVTLFVGSQLAASVAECLLCRRALRRRAKKLRTSVRFVDAATIRLVAALSAGSLLVVAGNMLAAQGFIFFVGKRLGMQELGGLAIVLTIRRLLLILLSNVSGVLTPAVSSLDAANSSHQIAKLFVAATKFGVVMAVAICLVPLAVAVPGMRLWVGEEFVGLDRVLYILLISLILLSPSSTSQQILIGLGKVRLTGPLVFLRGALGLVAAFVFVETVSRNLEGAVLCAYGFQVLGGIILFAYAARVTGQDLLATSMRVYGKPMLFGIVAAGVTGIVATGIGSQRWWQFFTAVAVGELVYLALVLGLALSEEERHRFISFAQRASNRISSMANRQAQTDRLPVS